MLAGMSTARPGAERYFESQRKGPEYECEFQAARRRIGQIDAVMRMLDEQRSNLDLSKAELARRAGLRPEAVRRLFSAEGPNPTLATLVALTDALDLELVAEPQPAKLAS